MPDPQNSRQKGPRKTKRAAAADRGHQPTTVDIDEFQAARRDPAVQEFLREAVAYGDRLEREHRNR